MKATPHLRALCSLSGLAATVLGTSAAVGQAISQQQNVWVAAISSVIAVLAGYSLERAAGKPEQTSVDDAQLRNNHLKRGVAAALQSALGNAPDWFRNSHSVSLAIWDNQLERALNGDDALLNQLLQGDRLENAWAASNQFASIDECVEELTELLNHWLILAAWEVDQFPTDSNLTLKTQGWVMVMCSHGRLRSPINLLSDRSWSVTIPGFSTGLFAYAA